MEMISRDWRSRQGAVHPCEHRNVRAVCDLTDPAGVSCGQVPADIAGRRRDGEDLERFLCGNRRQEGDCVVDARIAVDDEGGGRAWPSFPRFGRPSHAGP
jgi:hypothetical protein